MGRAAAVALALCAAGVIVIATVLILFDSRDREETVDALRRGAGGGEQEAGDPSGIEEGGDDRIRLDGNGRGGSITLRGSLAMDGAALAGVTVQAFNDRPETIPPSVANLLRSSPLAYGPSGSELEELLDGSSHVDIEPDAAALTQPDGSFTLSLRQSETVTFGLDHDFFYLPGSQAGPHTWSDDGKNPSLPAFDGRLEARLGGMVRGTVRDGDGFPLEGVVVELLQNAPATGMWFGGGGDSEPEPFAGTAVTDALGAYALRAVPPGEGRFLKALCDGWAPARSRPFAVAAGQVLVRDLRLERGAAIEAVVRDPGGKRLEGADVILEMEMNKQEAESLGRFRPFVRMMGPHIVARKKTGAEGAAVFTALEPAEYTIRAGFPGMLGKATDEPVRAAEPDRTYSVALDLQWGLSLSGRTVDAEKDPIAGAHVRAQRHLGRGGRGFGNLMQGAAAGDGARKEAFSSADGSFTITGLAPDAAYDLRAAAKGFTEAARDNVDAGTGDITIVMERPGEIEGRVIARADSRPVTHFFVRIAPAGEDDEGRMRPGVFNLPNRNTGGRDRASEGRGGGADPRGGMTRVQDGVIDAMRRTFRDRFALSADRTDREDEVRDREGRFSLRDVLPGDYRLCVSAPGFSPEVTETITVEKAETRGDVVVDLGPEASISGRVIAPSGPVAGAAVAIESSGDPEPRLRLALQSVPACESDGRGEFRLDGLPPGEFTLSASHPDHPGASTDPLALSAGRILQGVVISLPAGGMIRGTAFGREGDPLIEKPVLLTSNRGWAFTRRIQTDRKGYFEFKGLAAGEYTVRLLSGAGGFFGPGSGPDAVAVTLAGGEVREVVVREEPLTGAVVHGVVRNGGAALDNGFLSVTPIDGGPTRSSLIDLDGSYEVEGIAPGQNRFTIRFRDDDGQESAAVTREIPDHPDVLLDVELPGGSVSGTVADASTGMALEGVRLTVAPESEPARGGRGFPDWGGMKSTVSGEDGAFIFRMLPPGTYTIEARPPPALAGAHATGYFPARLAVILPDEHAVTGVRILLGAGGGVRIAVRDSDGGAFEGALVTATRIDEGESGGSVRPGARGRSDEEGWAALLGMAPGLYEITVQARDMGQTAAESVQVREGQFETVTVALAAGFEVSVRLVDEQGRPVAGAVLTLRDSRGRRLSVPPPRGRGGGGTDSVRSLGFLAAGTYTLEVRWSEGADAAVLSVAGPGERTVVLKKD